MSIDWAWVSRQLGEENKRVTPATVNMLKAFVDLSQQYSLDDDEARLVLAYTQKLGLGHAILREIPDERWGDVTPGEFNIRDKVRVREDAYTGKHGQRHNGKRGRIVAVHQGKVVVNYDDAKNADESFYHEPPKLQRLL